MKKLLTLFTLLLTVCSGAWGQDITYNLSSFSVTNTTYTFEFSENKIQNKVVWVEVPSSTSVGTITFKGSANKDDRYLYIYKTAGTVKDETRKIVMNTSWPTPIDFSSSDIKTSGGKYYLVFSTSNDFKTTGVRYTLTDPSGLEITPASGFYASKASVTMSANDGYTIYYTDNGTEPSKSSTVYTGTFDVTSNKTIKAIAYKGEDYGSVQTATYTIIPENRIYLANPIAADFTALRENTANFDDNTNDGYIQNKVQFNKDTDYALEGSDGTDISVAQGLLIRSTNNFSVGDFRYYYKDDDYKFYSNKSNTSYKIPGVKAGQKVIFEMSASGGRTITGTNTDEASQSYTSGSIKKLTFTATADGTVTLTNSGSSFVYSIEVKTPVYYHVTYDLDGGTGTTPTETDKEEGDKFTLHDGTTDITAPDGKEFDGWSDGTNTYAGGAEYTMPDDDVILTAQWKTAETKYTVTYDVNGGGSCATASATQPTVGAALTLPTPTWDGYTFDGWYNAGSKIGDAGAEYTPKANITLYAKWTDNIEGKLFSYVDGNYGDKFKPFDGSGWVTANATGKSKTFTDEVTGAQFVITNGAWDVKATSISALAKYKAGSTSMKVVVPTGYKATVNIWYNSYGESKLLKVDDDAQTAPGSNKLNDNQTNAQIYSKLVAVTVTEKNGDVVLTSSGGSDNIYIARVAVTLTHVSATISAAGYATFSSTEKLDFTGVEGLTAYKATATGESSVTLKDVTGIVPAETGLLLKGAANTYYIPVSTADATADVDGNLLQSATEEYTVTGEEKGTAYVFGSLNEVVGFYKAAVGKKIGVGKSWLLVPPATPINDANFLSFVFGDEEQGETDGIKAVSTKVENGVRYNLAGQKVGADYKGIVIVNGKKYLNK